MQRDFAAIPDAPTAILLAQVVPTTAQTPEMPRKTHPIKSLAIAIAATGVSATNTIELDKLVKKTWLS